LVHLLIETATGDRLPEFFHSYQQARASSVLLSILLSVQTKFRRALVELKVFLYYGLDLWQKLQAASVVSVLDVVAKSLL